MKDINLNIRVDKLTIDRMNETIEKSKKSLEPIDNLSDLTRKAIIKFIRNYK